MVAGCAVQTYSELKSLPELLKHGGARFFLLIAFAENKCLSHNHLRELPLFAVQSKQSSCDCLLCSLLAPERAFGSSRRSPEHMFSSS